MILQINTDLLKKIDHLTINQLVFLSLVLDNNQKSNQDIATIVSQVNDNEIQDLVERDFLIKKVKNNKVSYEETKKLVDLLIEENLFDKFKEIFPKVVIRPDGTRSFLHSNAKKCRDLYNKIVKNDLTKHNHIIDCLKKEIEDKILSGKLCYMKTMWKWITNSEWENYEETKDESTSEQLYGTNLL